MAHRTRLLLLTLVLSLVATQWSPVAAFDDFLDDIFSIFFDSESDSESEESIQVNGKHGIINVTCDNCTLTINCPNCNSMSTVGGMMTTVSPTTASPTPNGGATMAASAMAAMTTNSITTATSAGVGGPSGDSGSTNGTPVEGNPTQPIVEDNNTESSGILF